MAIYTLSVLQSLLYDQLDSNFWLFPSTQVTAVLNEAVRKVNNVSGIVENTVIMPTVANTPIYQTPAPILIPTKIYYGGVELAKYSLRQLAAEFRNWLIESSPAYGPIARWAPIGQGFFVLHPMPTISNQAIDLQGVAPITPMVSSSDEVDLDDELVPILIDYARGRIMLKIGGKAFANASLAYQGYIRAMKELEIWQGMVFPSYFVSKQLEGAEGKGT